MGRRQCKGLIFLVSLAICLATIYLPLDAVSAAVSPVSGPITFELTSSQVYQRPLYPADLSGDSTITYTRADFDFADLGDNFLSSDYSYDTFDFDTPATGRYSYLFTVTSDENMASFNTWEDSQDLMFWLYEDSFDPADPTAHFVAMNDSGDDIGYYQYPKLELELAADTHYVLVMTTYYAQTTGTVTAAIDVQSLDPDPEENQQDDPPADDPPADNQSDDEQSERDASAGSDLDPSVSSLRTPAKRDPITILHSTTGVRTEDLSYLAAIPEQWMADVTYVEFWLDAVAVTDDPGQIAAVSQASSALQAAGRTLLETRSVSLMSRVTWRDRTQVNSPIDPTHIRGNIPVLLPIPSELLAVTDLDIACIDTTGAVAFLASERVAIEGVEYLRFENNNLPAVYGFVE